MRYLIATGLAVAVMLVGGCGSADLGNAPDVRGLSLPSAKQRLESAGYRADVQSDAMFGVIVESNWTVCDEDSPQGKLVPIKVDREC
jgi:hypothetical protein